MLWVVQIQALQLFERMLCPYEVMSMKMHNNIWYQLHNNFTYRVNNLFMATFLQSSCLNIKIILSELSAWRINLYTPKNFLSISLRTEAGEHWTALCCLLHVVCLMGSYWFEGFQFVTVTSQSIYFIANNLMNLWIALLKHTGKPNSRMYKICCLFSINTIYRRSYAFCKQIVLSNQLQIFTTVNSDEGVTNIFNLQIPRKENYFTVDAYSGVT